MTNSDTLYWSLTVWRHFGIELPSAWEMLLYSRNLEKGRCSFADRYQVRLEMNWRRVPGPPDRERMLSDYRSRLEEQGWEAVQRVREGSWDGLVGEQDGQPVSRFGHYFPGESCVVELVFLWPVERECALERRVLKSVAEVPSPDGEQIWRAFGLYMHLPKGLLLDACQQYAARTEFVFKATRGVEEYRFMRLGMLATWLTASVEQWLPHQAPKGVTLTAKSVKTISGHDIAYVAGRAKRWYRGIRLHRPLYESWAAICPADGRLYFTSSQGRVRRGQAPLPCACGRGIPALKSGHTEPLRKRSKRQTEQAGSWMAMLDASPLRNEAARVEEPGDGTVVVHVPRKANHDLRPPLSWIVPVGPERRIVLDGVGHQVWALCGQSRTVEEIIDIFAARHLLTFHEARVSVTDYLKQLIRRGVLAIKVVENL
ncbi:MAG: PqqD family protein [Verrucomicrobia bacterium]|nr:PqqD family protein [Verrucomicrobiota bacterium]